MATSFGNVYLGFFDENCQFKSKSDSLFTIDVSKDSKGALLQFRTDGQSLQCVYEERHDVARVGKQCLTLSTSHQSLLLKFPTENDMKSFHHLLKQLVSGKTENVFDDRTDEASASQYFQFYGFLSQQQNMMQDYIRTSTYQRAMLSNVLDFHDKVILDVGAGSGILSFFAVQSGAAKVYAIEASSMALHCETLVRNNKLSGRIIVLPGKVEEIELPEKVDVIISEPMGYMLFNERMLESYLHAKKWLKPGGKMFPTVGDLHISPFTDDALYMEQFSKANFWYQQSFHGVDLASLREAAVKEYFKQPIVDTFDIRICMARSYKYTVNFQTAHETDLHHIDIPVTFSMLQSGTVHGLAFWFDVAFLGSGQAVWLSTSPTEPLTHWYQVRCLLQQPVFVKQGQTVTGRVVLKANKRQSYDVDIEIDIPGTNSKTVNNLDLKNPFFRYTGQQPAAPPGNTTASPSEAYWNTLATVNSQVVYNVLNGYLSAGDATHGVVQNNLIPLEQQHYMSGMVNGMTGVSLQQGVDHQNLIANTAPINPGSIPSVGNYTSQANLRTSIGAGISPAVFQQQNLPVMSSSFPVSNQFMIGDYALQGTNMVTSQIQGAGDYKN